MEILFTITIFLAVLVLLVVIHELGHFFAAKRGGVRVDEFGFGFPPKIFGRKYGETEYTINALPLGGFVKIKGIAGDDEEKPESDDFQAQSFVRKLWILMAGIVMNFVLSIVLFAIAFMIGVQTDPGTIKSGGSATHPVVIAAGVAEGGAADRAGIIAGDQVVEIDGVQVTSVDEFRGALNGKIDQKTDVLVVRGDELHSVAVYPELIESDGKQIAGVGVDLAEAVTAQYPLHLAIYYGAQQSLELTVRIFQFLGGMIASIFTSDQVDTESVAGPVGLAVIIRGAAESGIGQLIQMSGFLSVNLAVFNLLPIPMLDGGRIFLLIAERVRRKKLSAAAEGFIHNIGFLLLLIMVIVVTLRDIIRL